MTPTEHLRVVMREYPNTNKYLHKMIYDKGTKLPNWPDWCLLPTAGWLAIVSDGGDISPDDFDAMQDIARLAALGTWQFGMGIYRFAPKLYEGLIQTEIVSAMPTAVFQRLPEWCIYVETPGLEYRKQPLDGFWAHMEWDVKAKRSELRLLLHQGERLTAMPLHLGNWGIVEAAPRAYSEDRRLSQELRGETEWRPEAIDIMSVYGTPLVSLLMCLCSGMTDVEDDNAPGERPMPAKPQSTRYGPMYIPANAPRIWTVGE